MQQVNAFVACNILMNFFIFKIFLFYNLYINKLLINKVNYIYDYICTSFIVAVNDIKKSIKNWNRQYSIKK